MKNKIILAIVSLCAYLSLGAQVVDSVHLGKFVNNSNKKIKVLLKKQAQSDSSGGYIFLDSKQPYNANSFNSIGISALEKDTTGAWDQLIFSYEYIPEQGRLISQKTFYTYTPKDIQKGVEVRRKPIDFTITKDLTVQES